MQAGESVSNYASFLREISKGNSSQIHNKHHHMNQGDCSPHYPFYPVMRFDTTVKVVNKQLRQHFQISIAKKPSRLPVIAKIPPQQKLWASLTLALLFMV